MSVWYPCWDTAQDYTDQVYTWLEPCKRPLSVHTADETYPPTRSPATYVGQAVAVQAAADICIIDMQGQLVYQTSAGVTVDLPSLAPGLYILVTNNDQYQWKERFLVVR